jgi:Zn-finger protein
MMMPECDFCLIECDGKNILRIDGLERKDGKDIVVCNDCLNLYAAEEFDKLTEKIDKSLNAEAKKD